MTHGQTFLTPASYLDARPLATNQRVLGSMEREHWYETPLGLVDSILCCASAPDKFVLFLLSA